MRVEVVMKKNSAVSPEPRAKRVAPVTNPRYIELNVPDRALEYFIEDPMPGYIHILRFSHSTQADDTQTKHEGFLIGQSDSPEAPRDDEWDGGSRSLRILSEIDLGRVETRICKETGKKLSENGQINSDPIVFVNFDPATHQFRDRG